MLLYRGARRLGPDPCGQPNLLAVNLISYSDCNLISEQWLVALQGEGVETTELDVPIDITWSQGEATVRSTKKVDPAVRVVGWIKQEAPTLMSFYVMPGD